MVMNHKQASKGWRVLLDTEQEGCGRVTTYTYDLDHNFAVELSSWGGAPSLEGAALTGKWYAWLSYQSCEEVAVWHMPAKSLARRSLDVAKTWALERVAQFFQKQATKLNSLLADASPRKARVIPDPYQRIP